MSHSLLPSSTHPVRSAILLVNLGTPDAPEPTAVAHYLREFLQDRRVVETSGFFSRLAWRLLLESAILPRRCRHSAEKYALIWGADSPLREHTAQQAALLKEELVRRQADVAVFWAMRYGHPKLAEVLNDMQQSGIGRLLFFPLYPQYAASTTASAMDTLADWLKNCRNQPELRVIRSFPVHTGYLAALVENIQRHWAERGALPPDGRLLLSFHGLPEKCRDLGDPYDEECRQTTARLIELLGLNATQAVMTFQSRFGRARWLRPDTAGTLQKLAAEGIRRVDVICPGFVADCLETLEEIALTNRQLYLDACRPSLGACEYHYIPALNSAPRWITSMADLALENL
jgi:ferrochelatase